MDSQILAAFIAAAATIAVPIAALLWRMSNSVVRLEERVKNIERTIQNWSG